MLNAKIDRYPGETFSANPSDHPIRITEKDFSEPYIVLGEVTTKGYDDRVVDVAGKEELCRLARSIGGDGVIRMSRKYVEKREWGPAPEKVSGYGVRDQDKSHSQRLCCAFQNRPITAATATPWGRCPTHPAGERVPQTPRIRIKSRRPIVGLVDLAPLEAVLNQQAQQWAFFVFHISRVKGRSSLRGVGQRAPRCY